MAPSANGNVAEWSKAPVGVRVPEVGWFEARAAGIFVIFLSFSVFFGKIRSAQVCLSINSCKISEKRFLAEGIQLLRSKIK